MWPFKPSDWIPIHIERETFNVWTVVAGVKLEHTKREKYTVCTLYHSPSRNKYRIDVTGHIPNFRESQIGYVNCVKEQIEHQNLKNNVQ